MGENASDQTSATRVCIKNLPPTADEIDLREFLTENAKVPMVVTDARLLKNGRGKSRKVAFVGFRSAEMADHAVRYFHRAYMRSCRISVEKATVKKDEAAAEARDDGRSGEKKSGEGTDAGQEETDPANSSNSNSHKTEGDQAMQRRKEEFLQVMGGKSRLKFWADDAEATANDVDPLDSQNERHGGSGSGNDCGSDDNSSTDSSGSSSSDDDDESDVDDDGNEMNISPNNVVTSTATAPMMSDLDFLRSKQTGTAELMEEQQLLVDPSTLDAASDAIDKQDDDETGDADNRDSNGNAQVHVNDINDDDDDDDIRNNADARHVDESGAVQASSRKVDRGENHGTSSDESNTQKASEVRNDESLSNATNEERPKNRLFVRNLPFGTTEDELQEHFEQFGAITECHIPVDDKKRNKGFAFLTFASAADAHDARYQLDKKDFQGRLIHILLARPSSSLASEGDISNMQDLSWKKRQELQRKQKDVNSKDGVKGWSASFVRGDAVVDNIADRLGIRKGDLLGVKDGLDSGDAAVRLALAETQIIEENRAYFKDHGINMDSLISAADNPGDGKGVKRSKTSLLVKNLPYDTTTEELSKLFHFGDETVNILLPPSKTIAVVEYSHPSLAKQAFRKLAYKRFKHVPIYLEWAPVQSKIGASAAAAASALSDERQEKEANGSGVGNDNSNDNGSGNGKKADSRAKGNVGAVADGKGVPNSGMEDSEVTAASDGVSASLYVKNLNFVTTEDALKHFFERSLSGSVISVRIPRKVSPSGQASSMGYGFVELKSHDEVRRALKTVQGRLLDGHALDLKVSTQHKRSSSTTAARNSKVGAPKNATKLMVRNVPFQATRKELLKLFGSFGQLRKVRLPKKFDGSHRGFAFVEYVTTKEAENGMAALSKTHLYGRHLVIEWANGDDDEQKNIDRLRAKAKRDVATTTDDGGNNAPALQQPKNKKIRFT